MLRQAILVVALVAAGCGGSASPTTPSPAPTATAPSIEATLSSIQTHVFSARCATCHAGTAPEGGLRLVAGQSYANLVNVPSTQRQMMRVAPNNADASYLIHKLEGRAGIDGHQMPPPPLLSAEALQAIRRWIDQGAQNN
jgi:mono/diheme cytochrome c family protein